MGIDDLSGLQLLLPMLALLITTAVSAPASLVSHGAWKWSLARIADRRGVGLPRTVGMVALVATGAPAAYCLLLWTTFPGALATLGLAIVTAAAVWALIGAAYRAERIRAASADRRLLDTLSSVPHAGNRRAQLDDAAKACALPSFTGTTRRRSLVLAGVVLLAWLFVAAAVATR